MGIGPSSRETSLHHFRDPLLEYSTRDKDINIIGVLVAGTPEVLKDKNFIASRSGVHAEMLGVDGVIVSIDSWGNSHVDFSEHIRSIGERNIPVVGMSFMGNQASFVVKNKYMNYIVDFNKNDEGIETLVVGENTVVDSDVKIALGLLKYQMKRRRRFIQPLTYNSFINIGSLKKEYYNIKEVEFSHRTEIIGSSLYIKDDILKDLELPEEVETVSLRIIKPNEHRVGINCILDFIPIGTKIDGEIGSGITRILDGVVIMPTAVDIDGVQPANIGSSEGILMDRVRLNRPGTPADDDYIINVELVLKKGQARTREGIMAAYYVADLLANKLRKELRKVDQSRISRSVIYNDYLEKDKARVLIIKLVSGLGNMYETSLFPREPAGFIGSDSIISFGNLHMAISPNEYRDGAVHSLT